MLYPKKNAPLSPELFANPGSEYRATPFWAWNNKLDQTELLWQIEQLKQMGFGGFHMHVRTGMGTEYLSDAYMELVRACVEKASAENMLAWLYDEDRWPSGAAGGLVTRHAEYRQRYLVLTRVNRQESDRLLARFQIRLNVDGTLAAYRLMQEDEPAGDETLYAYEETAPDNPWFNNQAYLNTLDSASVRAFIHTTYDRYQQLIAKDFGGTVPAIFTDEPQFAHKGMLTYAHGRKDVILPWTWDLPDTYQAAYGENLLACLPELLWDLPSGQISQARYRYHDHVAERFASAFADQCGKWCAEHGLMLTGHMMEEPSLESQTSCLGEAMRSYRAFQLPGIDMLCDWREFTTAKQAQSAARQYGRPGVLSELYGVTNWDFDFRRHKLQGDWQAALGVTVRVPHLSWVSMNGEAKRDYPASFNYQAPWYQEYPYIEDHFARVNTTMTRGKPVCRVGVIHPIESYWLHWGARENTQAVRAQMDRRFRALTEWLLLGLIDFDFICESLLPEQCPLAGIRKEGLPVGEMRYEVIIVPTLETIRTTTLECLEKFVALGGRVVFLGDAPALIDAYPGDRAQKLWSRCEHIAFDQLALLGILADVREIEIRDSNGVATENLIYQLREEEGLRWLFIGHADKPRNCDIPQGDVLRFKIKGAWGLTRYDTLTGTITPLAAEAAGGWTTFHHPFYEHDSLLLQLDGCADSTEAPPSLPVLVDSSLNGLLRFPGAVPVTLQEPNVLLLDMAEFSLDGEPFRPVEEILRLDNILRRELGWSQRGEAVAQPWVEADKTMPHTLRLRYTFFSEMRISGTELALENAAITEVTLNGVAATLTDGWYVDKCIGKVALADIIPGVNTLELRLPYGKTMDVEACYLLGNFGVKVEGMRCALTKPVEKLAWGDITRQGLPFYGGNLTYHLEIALEAGAYEMAVTNYRGHLLRLSIDDKDAGVIAFSPYRVKTAKLDAGSHRIDLTLYGSRINTFGQLHQADKALVWWGPNSWRSSGASWAYEYQLWPQGVMKAIEVYAAK